MLSCISADFGGVLIDSVTASLQFENVSAVGSAHFSQDAGLGLDHQHPRDHRVVEGLLFRGQVCPNICWLGGLRRLHKEIFDPRSANRAKQGERCQTETDEQQNYSPDLSRFHINQSTRFSC